MKRGELFAILRKQGESLAGDVPHVDVNKSPAGLKPGTPEYINYFTARHNHATLQELIYSTKSIDSKEIPDDIIEGFSELLDAYLDKHAPNDPTFKEYIRIISLYLTFIVEEPLHPTDMLMPGIHRGISKTGKPYCTGDKSMWDSKTSLCHFCTASLSRPSDSKLTNLKELD